LRNLAERLTRHGGVLRTGVRAVSLLSDGGRVSGVAAEVNRARETITARCVVLADGGFQGDAELVGRYICPHPEKLVQRSAGTGRGDCLRMAAALGAKLVNMDMFYGHLLSRAAFDTPNLWPYPGLDSLTNGSILVNADGKRIFDEGGGGILLSNQISRLEDPTSTWIVFDEAIWATTGHDEVVPANPHLVEAGGTVLSAPSLAELAQKMGMNATALAATVAEYNAAVVAGTPERLVPSRSPGRRFGVIRNDPKRIPVRAVEHAPFYAAPLAVGISCTLGGIAIDTGGHVLDQANRQIPRLYAAGSTTGGIEGGPAAGYIGGLALSYCTALLAAEACAADR
jgi:fumarate reductase flavoprotein subunit